MYLCLSHDKSTLFPLFNFSLTKCTKQPFPALSWTSQTSISGKLIHILLSLAILVRFCWDDGEVGAKKPPEAKCTFQLMLIITSELINLAKSSLCHTLGQIVVISWHVIECSVISICSCLDVLKWGMTNIPFFINAKQMFTLIELSNLLMAMFTYNWSAHVNCWMYIYTTSLQFATLHMFDKYCICLNGCFMLCKLNGHWSV